MEIERKYLVAQLPPNLEEFEHIEIEQGYLCTSPTLRIRKAGDAYILTVKENRRSQSGAIVNREEEFALSPDDYKRLRTKCDRGFVTKTRYFIDLRRQTGDGLYSGLVAELDIFHDANASLILVEVEFPDENVAKNFVKPIWFGDEVSSDPHYRNTYLAQKCLL